jgi:hypothetical protein
MFVDRWESLVKWPVWAYAGLARRAHGPIHAILGWRGRRAVFTTGVKLVSMPRYLDTIAMGHEMNVAARGENRIVRRYA